MARLSAGRFQAELDYVLDQPALELYDASTKAGLKTPALSSLSKEDLLDLRHVIDRALARMEGVEKDAYLERLEKATSKMSGKPS